MSDAPWIGKSKDAAVRGACDSLWSKQMAHRSARSRARPRTARIAVRCTGLLRRSNGARARARPTRVRRLDRARRFVLERTRARRCSHPRALAARGGSDHSPRLSLSGTA